MKWILYTLLGLASFSGEVCVQASAEDARRVTFEVLAGFKYEAGDAAIPQGIKELDGKRVTVIGYMVPTKLEGTQVKEFLLVRNPMMCCYGVVPQVNEWVAVTMDKPVAYLPDVPRAVEGTIHVGEAYENGYLTGLYRVDGTKFGDDKP